MRNRRQKNQQKGGVHQGASLDHGIHTAYLYYEQGRPAEAEAECLRVLAIEPQNLRALHLMGMLRHQADDNEAATRFMEAATIVDPFNPTLYSNLAGLAVKLGRPEDAETWCRKALALKPDHVDALNNLAGALWLQGRLGEAVTCFKKLSELSVDSADAYSNLGVILKEMGQVQNAYLAFLRAIEIDPTSVSAHTNLGGALKDLGRPVESSAAYRKALELQPQQPANYSNLLYVLQYDGDLSPEEVLAEHRRFAERFESPLKPHWRPHGNERDPARRLKVGYVSPDFRNHAVAYFIEPVLANHDRQQVEVFCYYSHVQQDEVTQRLKTYADVWVECSGMTDERLAERIRADGIDILVDLAGHTARNRLLTFARKPAPIQMTYLGYPGTSGLEAMDYRLTDGCADPAGAEAYYTETLLRLPDSLCCYRPEARMPEVGPLPALANGYVTFGSFNNYNKIDDLCLQLWSVILRSVPDARLLMVTVPEGEARDKLLERFEALGVRREQLELHDKLPSAAFHEMMGRADIALDPLAMTGGTTTCETLWMGVPVVVRTGDRYVTRVGYSFLSAAGLKEFAADWAQAYVDLAIHLATNLPLLAELRAGLRAHVAASALVDEVRFTRNLEGIYREVWTRWCGKAA